MGWGFLQWSGPLPGNSSLISNCVGSSCRSCAGLFLIRLLFRGTKGFELRSTDKTTIVVLANHLPVEWISTRRFPCQSQQ